MSLISLVGLGVVIHVILLLSIFDIYFTSPIIRGLSPVANTVPPLSKRVVVISVDGLRYDALLENDSGGNPIAPYIRGLMAHRSSWGVSHTHLPTESRPGHVAMLAGFYEDPSAVTKGWKENPVDFDSIFNRSVCSFAWGSPDIVNIFYKDLQHQCSYKYTYEEAQDFAGKTWEQDDWVLNHVTKFFKASGNPQAYSKDGSLFFLHLLGQDTSGHTHKPHTDLYRYNLQNVDRIVKEVDELFNRIFMDKSTAFVLTADHGMTDWGSHGAGDPTETLTPVVAWGKGIKVNTTNKLAIDQADITPLLAALLGVSIPVNSVGVLPLGFLNASQATLVQLQLLNALQIQEQYLARRTHVETKSSFLHYKKLPELENSKVQEIIQEIKTDLKYGRFPEAREKTHRVLQVGYTGLDFYQKYFQTPLFVVTSINYGLWICYLLSYLAGTKETSTSSPLTPLLGTVLSIGISYVIHVERFPVTYHAYVLLPIILCCILVYKKAPALIAPSFTANNTVSTVFILTGVEFFVLGFFYRWIWSIILAALVIWARFGKKKASSSKAYYVWAVSGVFLALFSLLPVVGAQPQPLLNLLASVAIFAVSAFFARSQQSGLVDYLRVAFIMVAGLNSYIVHTDFVARGGVGWVSQYISWFLLFSSVVFVSRREPNILTNLTNCFSALSIPFLLLSVSHEALFLLSLLVHLSSWVVLEMNASDVVQGSIHYQEYTRPKIHEDDLTKTDVRRAYFFLAYVFIAFFGIGNLATLNSFDPAWVRCFLTTFSPFTMTTLILVKVIVPFFAVSLAFRALALMLNLTPYKTFITVLIYSNVMGLNFLFLVQNEGSWLEIGSSLSHYIIQQVTIVFLMVLYFASQLAIPDPVLRRDKSHYF